VGPHRPAKQVEPSPTDDSETAWQPCWRCCCILSIKRKRNASLAHLSSSSSLSGEDRRSGFARAASISIVTAAHPLGAEGQVSSQMPIDNRTLRSAEAGIRDVAAETSAWNDTPTWGYLSLMEIVEVDEELKPPIPAGSWLIAGAEALLGWSLAALALLLGARPLGWIIGGGAAFTLLMALAQALRRRALGGRVRPRPLEHLGLVLVSIALVWPVLLVATVVVLSYAGVIKWE
jgi:hypothetical protein